jgi:hypothetical protein
LNDLCKDSHHAEHTIDLYAHAPDNDLRIFWPFSPSFRHCTWMKSRPLHAPSSDLVKLLTALYSVSIDARGCCIA